MPDRHNVRSHRDPLRSTLFRLGGNRDGQLLLAVHVALSEQQRQCGLGETVIGIGSNDLWGWLHEHSESGSVHPNVDEIWASPREVQMGLTRLRKQGLVRGGPVDYGGPSLWRPTDAAADYLRARLLFRLDDAA